MVDVCYLGFVLSSMLMILVLVNFRGGGYIKLSFYEVVYEMIR